MFSKPIEAGNRALIASTEAVGRRRIGDVAKLAGLRAIGFVREPDQLIARTLLSLPDVLLIDTEMLHLVPHRRALTDQLHAAAKLRIVLCSDSTVASSAQCKRDGIDVSVNLQQLLGCDGGKVGNFWSHDLGQSGDVAPNPRPQRQALHPPPGILGDTPRRLLLPEAVVIGSSTGGPVALMTMLKGLSGTFPLPIAVVQHMPPGFTRMLAERLNAECALQVIEAESGMGFQPGTVYIAPGGHHMVLTGSSKAPRLALSDHPPENSCRPAVDVLFRSAAALYGGRQHAVVLTGMGRDGLLGATELYGLGARIVVQDAATSTVWGMPGAIAQAGIADDILPLDQIAPHLLRCL